MVRIKRPGNSTKLNYNICGILLLAAITVWFFTAGEGSDPVSESVLSNNVSGISIESMRPKQAAPGRSLSAETVAFVVSVTGCGKDPITEGAAVLKHSIHLSSIRANNGGKYDYKMYAIVHPDGEKCAMPLTSLGYEILKRDTPVAVDDIKGDFLRTHIRDNGYVSLFSIHVSLFLTQSNPCDFLFPQLLRGERVDKTGSIYVGSTSHSGTLGS